MARSGHINHSRRAAIMDPTEGHVRAYQEMVRQIAERKAQRPALEVIEGGRSRLPNFAQYLQQATALDAQGIVAIVRHVEALEAEAELRSIVGTGGQ